MDGYMNDLTLSNFVLNYQSIETLVLVLSVIIILFIQISNNRSIEKSIKQIGTEVSQIKKYSEVHSTYLTQFNDHFSLIDRRLKNIEEITALTSRDISSMADGITGEVGVGKAIELARRGASVDEILENSNLNGVVELPNSVEIKLNDSY